MASALDLAMARAQSAFAHAAPSDELDDFFAALRDSVNAARSGARPRRALPRSLATERIIEHVRL